MALMEIETWFVHVRLWMITDKAAFKIGEVEAGNPVLPLFTLHNVTYRRYLYARRATSNRLISTAISAQSPALSRGV
jgi:hypothetical protein